MPTGRPPLQQPQFLRPSAAGADKLRPRAAVREPALHDRDHKLNAALAIIEPDGRSPRVGADLADRLQSGRQNHRTKTGRLPFLLGRRPSVRWRRIKKLEHQLNSGDGSLFDLRQDAIETIVDVIAGSVPLGRFESLQRSMTKKLAALKAADKTRQAKAG
jgi:hypothetical protein